MRSRRKRSQASGSDDDGSATPGVLLGGRDRDAEPAGKLDPSQQEEAVNRSILDHLISRHSERLPEEDIRRTFEECVAQFSSARIREFVPVLAHRCAKVKLRAMASDTEHQETVRMTELLELEVRAQVGVQDGNGQRPGTPQPGRAAPAVGRARPWT